MATYDVVIVGGGIVGLWTARHAVAAGMRVAVVDRATCGSGASGTVLGALLPHLPRVMSAKKRFQFEALLELDGLITELEDETGRSTGYARCGRIMPIRTPKFLDHGEICHERSLDAWRTKKTAVSVEVVPAVTANGWIDPAEAPHGLLQDNLSAHVIAEQYLATLKASLDGKADILEGVAVTNIDFPHQRLITQNGPMDIHGGKFVLSAGYETYGLAETLTGRALGNGVKGQAAVFEIKSRPDMPVIYDNGTYIVPHSPTRCAVGSTSEETWDNPTTPDPAKTEAFIAHARRLCPPVRHGRLIQHWAGVRPRCVGKDPIVGCLDPHRQLYIATGGFKISFGIAHRVARRLVEEITEAEQLTEIPETYAVAHHLSAAANKP